MSIFFDETMQGLLEAAEIAKGNITLTEWENMPAPTFYVADNVWIRLLKYAERSYIQWKSTIDRLGSTKEKLSSQR